MPAVIKKRYFPRTVTARLGLLIEECGEVLAAAGKSVRFGLDSYNPELRAADREINRDWLLREIVDLERALAIARESIDDGGFEMRTKFREAARRRAQARKKAKPR